MKKILLGVCTVAVAAALICPKIVAIDVESNINNIVKKVNDLPGYTATVSELNSSWFSTDAMVKVSLDASAFGPDFPIGDISELAVDLKVNASHGPVLMTEDHSLGLLSLNIDYVNESLRDFVNWSVDQPIYNVQVHTNLLGNTTYKDIIEPFTVKDEAEDLDITFEGYQGSGILHSDSVEYLGKSKNTIINTKDARIIFGELTADMKVFTSFKNMFESSIYDSDTKISVSSVNANSDAMEPIFTAQNIYMDVVSEVNKESDLASIDITYGVDDVNVDGFQANDMALAIEINNISKEFIDAYQEYMSTLSKVPAEEQQAKLLEFMETNALSFLKVEPEMNISSLRGTLEQGSFEGSMNTSLTGITEMPAKVEDQVFWLSHLLSDGKVKGDKAVIEYLAAQALKTQLSQNPQAADMTPEEMNQMAIGQTSQLLQTLVDQGLLILNDDGYLTTFKFKGMEFTINDNPIPLPF